MCLINQTEPKRLGKNTIYWKVFYRKNRILGEIRITTLYSVRNEKCVPFHLPSDKPFANRFGYQVFETKREAEIFRSKFSCPPCYAIKPVEIKKGALYCKGVIGVPPAKGQPALRVSSLTILD